MEMKAGREIGLLVGVLVVVSRAVDGPPLWIACALTVAAVLAGTLHLLGEWRPSRVAVSAALPALAGFASIGVAHLLPSPAVWIVAPAAAIAVASVVELEIGAWERSHATDPAIPAEPTPAFEAAVTFGALGIGFLAFSGIGGLVPGALAGDAQALTWPVFISTVALDVAVGALVGLRLVALAGIAGRHAIVPVNQFVALSGHVGALVRAVGVRGLIGPALLIAAIYILDVTRYAHATSRARRAIAVHSGRDGSHRGHGDSPTEDAHPVGDAHRVAAPDAAPISASAAGSAS